MPLGEPLHLFKKGAKAPCTGLWRLFSLILQHNRSVLGSLSFFDRSYLPVARYELASIYRSWNQSFNAFSIEIQMKHYQDKSTGMIYAFEDDYDPFKANNRNLPTATFTEAIKPKPGDCYVWYQEDWIKQDDAPPNYTLPVSSVPSYNPAWMLHIHPYTVVYRDVSSGLNVTIDQVNENSYDGESLANVVAALDIGNSSGLPALFSYDGTIAIPQCDDYPAKSDGVSKLNEILCCLLLGGVHVEVLHSENLVVGCLCDNRRLSTYSPTLHTRLRFGMAALSERLMPLMHPRVLMVSDIKLAYSQGRQVVRSINSLSPIFLISGYTAMVCRNNSDALNNLWIVVEQLTEFLWVNQYTVNKGSFPARVIKCHAKAKKSIESDQAWAKQRQLRLAKIISKDCHKALSKARSKRNALAHQGIVPDWQVIASLWLALPELIEVASGIRSLGLRGLSGGVVENWGIPALVNFDEWLDMARRV